MSGRKINKILKEGNTLPFWILPNLTRSSTIISCYVNPNRNLYLLVALQRLMNKNALEPSNWWRPIPDRSNLNQFLKAEKFKTETPQNYQDLPLTRGVGDLNRFQGHLLPHTNIGTVQELSKVSHPGSGISVQGTAIQTIHSSDGVYCHSKESETNGLTQGYKDSPVPRRLVSQNQLEGT